MTPIKVRGKEASFQTESSKHSISSLLNPYPKTKRPLASPCHSSTPPSKFPRYANSPIKDVDRRARIAAPLEQLPTELLETIFLRHLNISLPQASPIIGSKLASKHVKTQVVLRVCSAGRLIPYPCEQAALFPTLTDHAKAQSAVLRMRWMTLPFIRQLIPDYIAKTLVRELGERGLQWLGEGPTVTKESESTIRQYLEDNSIRSMKRNQNDLPMFWNISWRVDNPSRFIRLSFGLHDGVVAIEERRIHVLEGSAEYVRSSSADRHQWRVFCGISGCEVPGKLLHGPWTTEKCDFLEMVIRGNATVDWVGTTIGEVAETGLMQALRDGNARATRLLVTRAGSGGVEGRWGLPFFRDGRDVEKVDSGPWPREHLYQASSIDLRGIGVIPRTEHLRSAVLESGCKQDVVETLLAAEDTGIDVEDRQILPIIDWAIGEKIRGDERGPWLLSMLSLRAAGTV